MAKGKKEPVSQSDPRSPKVQPQLKKLKRIHQAPMKQLATKNNLERAQQTTTPLFNCGKRPDQWQRRLLSGKRTKSQNTGGKDPWKRKAKGSDPFHDLYTTDISVSLASKKARERHHRGKSVSSEKKKLVIGKKFRRGSERAGPERALSLLGGPRNIRAKMKRLRTEQVIKSSAKR